MKKVCGSIVLVFATASFSTAAVNVDVNTPNASVHVGTQQPPPAPQVTVIERERVVEREHHHEGRKDRGKHKGEKKHKKDRHDERDDHHREHGDR